jgi:hypothetical protein
MHITHSIWSRTYSSRPLRALVLSAACALAVACDSGSGSDSVDSLGSDGGRADAGRTDAGTSEDGGGGGDTDAGELPSACPELETKTLTSDELVIAADTRWEAAIYKAPGGISVSGGTLTIDPCSVIELPGGAIVSVREGGAIKAVGTATLPIRFTSVKATGAAGDWEGFDIYGTSSNQNEFAYVVVEYSGRSSYGAFWIDRDATASIHDSTVQESNGVGVWAQGGAVLKDFARNTLRNNEKGAMRVGANGVDQLGQGTYTPNAVDGILIANEQVDHDATWLALDAPYIAESGFSAAAATGSALIVISAGTTLKLGPQADISIRDNAGLELAGTADAPVTLTSSKSAPAAGDWGEIDIYSGSTDAHNKFTHAVLEYGGSNPIYGMVWVERGAGLSATDSAFRHAGGFGVYADGDATLGAFSGNTITDCAKGPVRIGANGVDSLGAGTYSPNPVDAITVAAESIDHDATWLALDAPYAFPSGFTVGGTSVASAHLTVSAGATLKVAQSISVTDNGGLTLAGTADKHVTVTCNKATCAPGDWTEIDIYDASVDAYNVFTYTDIAYGGSGIYGQLWVAGAVTLNNTTFANARVCDVYVSSGAVAPAGTYTLCNP